MTDARGMISGGGVEISISSGLPWPDSNAMRASVAILPISYSGIPTVVSEGTRCGANQASCMGPELGSVSPAAR